MFNFCDCADLYGRPLVPGRWHAVATWQWDVNDERCGICYTAFEACCPDCHIPGDDCPPVWGRCNHAFHMHCIMKVGTLGWWRRHLSVSGRNLNLLQLTLKTSVRLLVESFDTRKKMGGT